VPRLAPSAHALAIGGALLVIAGWILGGFPSPTGAGATLFVVGLAVGLVAELCVWIASRRV
jgi:hypothetical protein